MQKDNEFDLDRLIENDPATWDRFVRRYSPVVYATVLRIAQTRRPQIDAADIEDIVQQIYVRLIERDFRLLRAYNPERASFATYLGIIGASTTLNCLKRLRLPDRPLEEGQDAASPAPSPERSGLSLSDIPSNLLSPRERLIMQLLFEDGRDVAEIASSLGIVAQTVRALKHRAITKLRKYLHVDESRKSVV